MIRLDLSGAAPFFGPQGPDYAAVAAAHELLASRQGPGGDFTGWLDLPLRLSAGELPRILKAAKTIRARSRALVVVGIGGSYLGARGAIELLRPVPEADDPRVFFVGNGLSADALNDVLAQLGDLDFDVNVISKSGTTLEPAVAFRIFRGLLEKKYPGRADEHIFATTDERRGVLKSLADDRGWESFVVPDDVGGRFSVLSAVGLLPMAVAGIDVERVLREAEEAFRVLDRRDRDNPAWQYAAARQHLYAKGYTVELLGCYEPSFRFMAEWWKQLYGESEGKQAQGIFPASVEFTADLHSMGQYIQEGPRDLMETVVAFEENRSRLPFPALAGDADGLDYLAGRDLGEICAVAMDAVRQAHVEGGVPNLRLLVPRRDEAGFAWMVCFFELACALSGYISGVNPFDQPGVEAYKKNMFRMLGKP